MYEHPEGRQFGDISTKVQGSFKQREELMLNGLTKKATMEFDAASQGLLHAFGLRLDLRSICFGNWFLVLCPQTSATIKNLSFHDISCN